MAEGFDMDADFVSKAALTRIKEEGVDRLLVGLEFDGHPLVGSNDHHWPIILGEEVIGHVTSAVYSPRLQKNIALAMVRAEHAAIGTQAILDTSIEHRECVVVPKPFYDPKKAIASKT